MSVTDGIGQTPCSFEHYLVSFSFFFWLRVLDKAEYSTFESTLNSSIVSYRIVTNKKSHVSFRWTPRSMTLDDLELLKVTFCLNFAWFRDIGRQPRLNLMKIDL